ncbi:MAG: murein biosynthesis integral membrane protein MurJ, partial [Anaerolineae bacterium]|nr:murein biosynthesis integral membrane protein MurJ [Anaerolineae bacterium]
MSLPPTALTNRQIARAAVTVLLGFVASGALGLIRDAVVTSTFGASAVLDSFTYAQRIPELLFVLVAGGALGSSFIPIFARFLQNRDTVGAWRLASAVMTLALLVAALLAIVMALAAQPIVSGLITPDAPAELQNLTTTLTQIMLLTVPIFSVSGLLMGVLNAHQLFTLPALAAAMYNVGQIFGALVLARTLPALVVQGESHANIYGLAWGTVIGAVLHLAVQLPGLRRVSANLRFLPNFNTPGTREVLLMMGPRVLGLAVVQINFLVNVALAYPPRMIAGSASVFTQAWKLMFFVLGPVAQSVGTALFPSLSALAAAGDHDAYKDRLASAMRGVLFLALPAAVGLIVLGEPVIRVLFERGLWTFEHSVAAAWALSLLAIGMPGHALLEVLARAFYALEDTRTPVFVGVAAMIVNITLSIILVRFVGNPDELARGAFAGLALANSLTTLLESGVLWLLLRRRIGWKDDAGVMSTSVRVALAAAGMGALIWWVMGYLSGNSVWVQVIIGVPLGIAVFFGLALLLRVNEASALPTLLLRRFKR